VSTELQNSPEDEDVIINYCPVCGRTERLLFKDGEHWQTPFFFMDVWWARGQCPSCTKKQATA
jgi:C4-type Zn-finger protein